MPHCCACRARTCCVHCDALARAQHLRTMLAFLRPSCLGLSVQASSQVEHFDKLRAADVQLVRKLHANINSNHSRAKGTEAGKDLS